MYWQRNEMEIKEMEQREAASHTGEVNQFLTFTLGAEEYGIEILKVQEIKGYSAITHIPNAPAHVKGVMNLRGTVVPVVDLRAKFGMEAVEYSKFTVIIVVMVGQKIAGLVVDAVSDVLNIQQSEVRPAPDFGARCGYPIHQRRRQHRRQAGGAGGYR
jgi:purine-binding chemotaxis protein CheW